MRTIQNLGFDVEIRSLPLLTGGHALAVFVGGRLADAVTSNDGKLNGYVWRIARHSAKRERALEMNRRSLVRLPGKRSAA